MVVMVASWSRFGVQVEERSGRNTIRKRTKGRSEGESFFGGVESHGHSGEVERRSGGVREEEENPRLMSGHGYSRHQPGRGRTSTPFDRIA